MTEYYDAIAPGYDALHKEEQLVKLMALIDLLAVTHKDRVLDVGCGTAFSFDALEVIGCRYQGVEPSAGLIAQSAPTYRHKITQCAAEELPFPDGLFTKVLSVTALQNFTNPKKGLQEMSRVCTGLLGISFLKTVQKREELDVLLREVFEVVGYREQDKDVIYVCKKRFV